LPFPGDKFTIFTFKRNRNGLEKALLEALVSPERQPTRELLLEEGWEAIMEAHV
jgi:hypothetical protein